MRKIPTVFQRDPADRRYLLPEVTPGCEWVLDGEGIATRKYDGTCVARLQLNPMDYDARWYARREVKPGNLPPEGWQCIETDLVTGKSVGWEPIENSPFAKFHAQALKNFPGQILTPGTFELFGPKINGNPEQVVAHCLIRHAEAEILPEFFEQHKMRSFSSIRRTVQAYIPYNCEGIVYHHPDGRMAKIKVRDFPQERNSDGL